jgi:Ca2+-binding RTX toxin-like protein
MPSLAVDKFGNMAIGFSVASGSLFPQIRYAGRLATDAAGALGQGETTLIGGAGAQTNACGSGACIRWGDYSAMTVDPVDDCTFWYTNEYYAVSGGDWQTRIGAFKFPACVTAPVAPRSYLPTILVNP